MQITSNGLISGIDVDSILNQLGELERKPVTQLKQREADFQVKLSAYGNIQGSINSLYDAMKALDTASDFDQVTTTSQNDSILSTSVSSGAVPGSYGITVKQLAQSQKLNSGAFKKDETLGEGVLQIKIGTGESKSIGVSATDTLSDLSKKINEASAGVSSNVVFDGDNYFLSLTAQSTGAASSIQVSLVDSNFTSSESKSESIDVESAVKDKKETDETDKSKDKKKALSRLVSSDSDQSLKQVQEAKDAIISVDGIENIRRNSNKITDVIPGVTLNLKADETGIDKKTTLTIRQDTNPIYKKIENFVNAYNKVHEQFSTYQKYEKDGEKIGELFGDNTTNLVRSSLKNTLTSKILGTDGFSRLSDLGIVLNKENKLEIKSTELNNALDTKFEKVKTFFTSTDQGKEGFAVRMINNLNTMADKSNGLLATKAKGIYKSIDEINSQVSKIEKRIETSQSRLSKQFQNLELLLGQYQATGDYLNQQISNLSSLVAKN